MPGVNVDDRVTVGENDLSFCILLSRYCIIDCFSLPVCKFGWHYCKAFCSDRADSRKYASKKEAYFGYKGHALITLEGYITVLKNSNSRTFFYLAGAYLRLFGKNKMKSRKGYAFISVVMWIMMVFLYSLNEYIGVNNAKIYNVSAIIINVIINYTIVPVVALCIFVCFESLELKYNKVINYIASTTLGIYLIHESLIGRNFIWYNLLKVDVMFEKTSFTFYALIDIVLVFVVCSIIDMVRMKIMKLMDRLLFNLKERA